MPLSTRMIAPRYVAMRTARHALTAMLMFITHTRCAQCSVHAEQLRRNARRFRAALLQDFTAVYCRTRDAAAESATILLPNVQTTPGRRRSVRARACKPERRRQRCCHRRPALRQPAASVLEAFSKLLVGVGHCCRCMPAFCNAGTQSKRHPPSPPGLLPQRCAKIATIEMAI